MKYDNRELKKDLEIFKPRKEQSDALKFINDSYNEDNNLKYFLLNLPTGVGKSHLGLMICDWYLTNVNPKGNIDIITNNKLLEDQYVEMYSSIYDLKGRANYHCHVYNVNCAEGLEFDKLNKNKKHCDDCPFIVAKRRYQNNQISLTNFYLYVIQQMYMGNTQDSRHANMLIIDEAHSFEEVMSNSISINLTNRIIHSLQLTDENELLKKFVDINNLDDYIDFIDIFKSSINSTLNELKKEMKIEEGNNVSSAILKRIYKLNNAVMKLDTFKNEYEANMRNFIMECSFSEKTKEKIVSIEPIWADEYLYKHIYKKYDMIFFMSGTILNKAIFCRTNGLNVDETVYYSIPSPFPVKNRPFYYMPRGKMSYKEKVDTFKRFVPEIKGLMDKYKGHKGIIHTNSFEFANWVKEQIKNKRFIFHDDGDKMEKVALHKRDTGDSVIVSPSVNTGMDFAQDYFQIILKVPFPSIASKKMKLKMQQYPEIYDYYTVAALLQTYGRIYRSKTDVGDTIMLDSCFDMLLHKQSSKILFPQWFLDAIIRIS